MKPITKCNHEANKELCDDCIAKNERVSNRIHGLVECQRENEYLKGVVKRLASMEAMTVAFAANIHSLEYKELRARMEYADKALND